MSNCQIYLVTPPAIVPAAFVSALEAALDAAPVACFELRLATDDAAAWDAAVAALRAPVQDRGVAFLTAGRPELAAAAGCDGTALLDPAGYRTARKILGANRIVGAWTGTSRHDAMVVGELGADFVGLTAEPELVGWWAELFEVPCVAGGLIDAGTVPALAAAGADFVAAAEAVWDHPAGPAAGIAAIAAALA